MEEEVFACWLCGEPADNWEMTVARVCRGCYAESPAKLQAAGFVVSVDDEKSRHPTITVTAPNGKEPLVGLIFGKETLRTMISKTFLGEVQVGARRFDDEVYLEFASEQDLPLLEGVEVEDLIIELVQDGVVHLILDHADIHVKSTIRTHTNDQLALLCAALINAVYERREVLGDPAMTRA